MAAIPGEVAVKCPRHGWIDRPQTRNTKECIECTTRTKPKPIRTVRLLRVLITIQARREIDGLTILSRLT